MTTDPTTLAFIALALIVAGFAKGVSGTGLPLVAVPLLTLAVDLPLAVALISVSLVGTNIVQAAGSSMLAPAVQRYWPLMVLIVPGTLLGTFLLAHTDPAVLERAAGALVVAFVVFLFAAPDVYLPRRWLRVAAPAAGFLAGVTGGMTAIFAPPLLVLLLWVREGKEVFVAVLALSYIVASVAMILFLARFSLMNMGLFLWSTAAMAPVLVGQAVGTRVRRFVSERTFQRVVQLILLAAGLKLLLA